MSKNKTKSKNTNQEQAVRQSFFAKTIVNYFRPTYYVKTVNDINLRELKIQGINHIICDLDNTLAPHYVGIPESFAISFINEAKKNNMNFYIVSNNIEKRVTRFSSNIENIDGYYYGVKKPFTFKIKKIMEENNIELDEVVMIGDQLEMDILAANILHVQSILVEPRFETGYDFFWLTNFIEKFIYKRLARFNSLRRGEYDKLDSDIDSKFL